jgi:nicotinamidase-related amidase
MTVTALDPKTALIVIDLQKGLVSLPTIHPIEGVVTHVSTIAAAFRKQGLPVVLVNVAGAPAVRTEQRRRHHAFPEGWTDLIPELNRQKQDHVVTKYTPGAFTKTGLAVHLQALGVTQIVITGIATSNGVEVTARQAYELGFNTTFAIDAMTDVDADAHSYSVTRVFPKIGETGTTGEIIALLKRGARS